MRAEKGREKGAQEQQTDRTKKMKRPECGKRVAFISKY
jgi:hypothetical protein